MSKRAQFMVMVAGTNITSTLAPVLISLTVSDKVGTHSDTANLEVDDTGGRIVLPQIGAPVVVALGWEGEGLRTVFTGTVDEVRSSGSRSGRTLSITAKLVKASNLSDLTDTAAARTNLGLGTMATQSAGAVAITGGSVDGIVLDGGTF